MDEPGSRRSPIRLLAMGMWLLLVAFNPGRNETLDVEMRRIVARQIWSTGGISISALPRDSRDTWIPAGEGRWVAPYGIGQSLAFVPFDAAGAVLERLSPPRWRERAAWLPIGLGLLPLLGLGWWYATLSLLEAWGFPHPWPAAGALVLSLGTIVLHYSSQGQEEALVGFFLTLSLLHAVRLRSNPSVRNASAAGLFAGLCLITRPVSLFALLAVSVIVFFAGRDGRRRWLALLAAAGASVLAVASLALLYNAARFGDPFAVGYDRLGHLGKIALDGRSAGVFLTLWLGPGVGLLALSPVLLLALGALPALWRQDRGYALALFTAVGACYLFFSSWHDSYTGSSGWGTRYQCHLLSLFAIPLTLGLRRLWEVRARTWVLALVAVSVLLQVASVFATHHLEVYQATCEGLAEAPFRTGLRDGQLGRRLENLASWATGAPPEAAGDESCRQAIALMWRRYVPNFWGPVFARRMGARGILPLSVWLLTLGSALVLLAAGLRRSFAEARVPAREMWERR